MTFRRAVLDLSFRYLILLFFSLLGMYLFEGLVLFLTVYPVFFIAYMFDRGSEVIAKSVLLYKGVYFSIIPACIAYSAYLLLLILNLTTPMRDRKRVNSLVFLMFSFLFFNIIRISSFMLLYSFGFEYFDEAHKFFWYFGSTVIVVALWFVNVRLFKINEMPIYSDFKFLIHQLRRKDGIVRRY